MARIQTYEEKRTAEELRPQFLAAMGHDTSIVRAGKEGEVPKFFMAQHKASRGKRVACADGDASTMEPSHLFINYDWLHEDGTTTPCGVEE